MKPIIALTALWLLTACSSTKPTTLVSNSSHQAKQEPPVLVIPAKLTFVADQKDYLPMMLGSWLLHTMQRQPGVAEESLNIYMRLNEDKSYTISTGCGEMKGNYSVKGVSIKFLDAVYDTTKCVNTVQLDELARLLTTNISLYTVNGNMLFLKDNSSHNVVRATR